MSGATRTIARNTVVQAAADILGKVATLAFYVVMARELGESGFGDFTLALSLALVLTVFAEFGTDEILTRTVAVERGTARQLLTDALLVKLAFGFAGVIGAIVVAFVGGYTAEVRAAVAILAVAAVVELLAKSFYATFQALDDMRAGGDELHRPALRHRRRRHRRDAGRRGRGGGRGGLPRRRAARARLRRARGWCGACGRARTCRRRGRGLWCGRRRRSGSGCCSTPRCSGSTR